jgi:hypothetical protein
MFWADWFHYAYTQPKVSTSDNHILSDCHVLATPSYTERHLSKMYEVYTAEIHRKKVISFALKWKDRVEYLLV